MEVIASYGSTTTPAMHHSATPQRSLKLKRSLSRLLSGSSRKSSRSRPSSPTAESPETPPTPQLPVGLWPLTPPVPGSPRSPKQSPPLPLERDVPKVPQQWRDPAQAEWTAEPAATESKVSGGGMRGIESTTSSSPTTEQELSPTKFNEATEMAEPVEEKAERPPSLPTNRKGRSLTGLRMPSGFNSTSRGRGTSLRLPHNKSSPTLGVPSRPSTAGGLDSPTKKATGKRRPHDTPVHGYEGSGEGSPESNDDGAVSQQRPWQARYNQEEVRSSFRSAITTGSSNHLETSSTERNSVATKGTSITESTIDPQSRPASKSGFGGGMTVDDAIDMYVAGFADDQDEGAGGVIDGTLSSEDERRRSMRIAEAISDNLGSGTFSSQRPVTTLEPHSTKTPPIPNGHKPPIQIRRGPPPIMPSTTLRDQYGFLKANHHVTLQRYDTWSADYLPSQERRARKWQTYMRECNLSTYQPRVFPPRSPKTQRFVLKGLPPAWRGAGWFYYAGGDLYLTTHPHLYANLLATCDLTLSENDKEAIERDLNRTFPDNIHFKSSPTDSPDPSPHPERPLLSSLRRVLRAFAAHNPKVGYCQSLNFIAGLLLLFLPEEKAFIMLHVITTTILPGTHDVSLEGANVDLWVLMVALKATQPTVWAKVGASSAPGEDATLHLPSAKLPPISLCTTSWFMSLFIGTLPIESVLRVWDVLFYDGARTLFRTALAIFKLGEKRIAELKDDMELFQIVQGLPRGMVDATALMRLVSRKGGVAGEWIEERRRERRLWYANERARVARGILGVVDEGGKGEAADAEGDDGAVRGLRRRNSIWTRKKSVVGRS